MRKWFWLVPLVLVAIAIVVSRGNFSQHPVLAIQNGSCSKGHQPKTALPYQVASRTGTAIVHKSIHPPRVELDNLLAHVEALNFKRYTETERDRARKYLMHSLKQLGWSPTQQTFKGGINILAEHKALTHRQAGYWWQRTTTLLLSPQVLMIITLEWL